MAGRSSRLSKKDLQFIAQDIGPDILPFITVETCLAGLSLETRLAGLSLEERLASIGAEDLFKILEASSLFDKMDEEERKRRIELLLKRLTSDKKTSEYNL